MNYEHEINDLKRRVGDLEGAVNVLSGHLGKVQPELSAMSAANSDRFDRIEQLIGKAASQLELLNTQVWSIRDDLPELLSATLQKHEQGGQ